MKKNFLLITLVTFSLPCTAMENGQEQQEQSLERKHTAEKREEVLATYFDNVRENNVEFAEKALNTYPYLKDAKTLGGNTALCIAAKNGYKTMAAVLVDKGIDINELGEDGRSPLGLAVTGNKITIAQYLLFKRANPREMGKPNLEDLTVCQYNPTTLRLIAGMPLDPNFFKYIMREHRWAPHEIENSFNGTNQRLFDAIDNINPEQVDAAIEALDGDIYIYNKKNIDYFYDNPMISACQKLITLWCTPEYDNQMQDIKAVITIIEKLNKTNPYLWYLKNALGKTALDYLYRFAKPKFFLDFSLKDIPVAPYFQEITKNLQPVLIDDVISLVCAYSTDFDPETIDKEIQKLEAPLREKRINEIKLKKEALKKQDEDDRRAREARDNERYERMAKDFAESQKSCCVIS